MTTINKMGRPRGSRNAKAALAHRLALADLAERKVLRIFYGATELETAATAMAAYRQRLISSSFIIPGTEVIG
jgi:hypothetical protein